MEAWTLEQHQKIAKRLLKSRNGLSKLLIELGESYSTDCEALKRAWRTRNALDKLLSELDDQLSREHQSTASASPYYPEG